MYIYVIRTSRWLRLTGASKVDTIFWQIMLPLEERCNNSEGFESWAWRVTVNYEGTELQTACTKGLGAGGAKRGCGSPPVCAESTQHCKETQHKEGGLPPPRERKLGSYSQDTTPRKRTGKGNSLHIVWASSKGQQEVIHEGHCHWDAEGSLPVRMPTFCPHSLRLAQGTGLPPPNILLTKTKCPRETSGAGTWFAVIKSEMSSMVWV